MLDVALVPERKGEESPQLAAEVLAAGDVVVQHACHGLGPEVALAAKAVRSERLAREGLEVTTQPRRRRYREPPLAAVDDLPRQQRLRSLAEQQLLAQPANLVTRRQRESEVAHERVEVRNTRLE